MTSAGAANAPVPLHAREQARQSGRSLRRVSVVLPCLNEEDAVGLTVAEAFRGLTRANVEGEVIVVDNGSTDRSVEVAEQAGATVVREHTRGYGAAHRAGIAVASGDVIVMADADQTYDLERVDRLLDPLREGADMVVGTRLEGVAPGAMPLLHRYVGTPVITRLLRILTGAKISDSQSGYRAFWRDQALALEMRTPGMEYASEMLLRAARSDLDIRETPSPYRVRVGESKLNTLTDGWRHLRMLLILSPHLTLLLPGLLTLVLGAAISGVSLFLPEGAVFAGQRWLPVFAGATLMIVGAQVSLLGALAAERSSLTPHSIQRRLGIFRRRAAVDTLLGRYALLAAGGTALGVTLLALWLSGRSSAAMVALAGLAQAAMVIGLGGAASVLSAAFARDSLWEATRTTSISADRDADDADDTGARAA